MAIGRGKGAWAGVANLVAMTSNAPPDVDLVAVAGSGRQGLQVLVFWSWLDDPA
jgi:hypothetical protein